MSAPLIDLSGKQFGKLTVLNFDMKLKKRSWWVCRCDCGNIKSFRADCLTNGASWHCGCEHKTNLIDLTGLRFSRWTVLKRSTPPNDPHKSSMWDVVCDCGSIRSVVGSTLSQGKSKSCGCYRDDLMSGEKNRLWIGGKRYFGYKSAIKKIGFIEATREDPLNIKAVQVRCSMCKNWITPTREQVVKRIAAIEGRTTGEQKFYCSDECKNSCPSFNQIKYPKGFKSKPIRQEILDPELRAMILDRDHYQCQICESNEKLEIHHIEGVANNPIIANDADNCIIVCHNCHKGIHKQPGCTSADHHRIFCQQGASI